MLEKIVERLARQAGRTEADIQSDVRALLLYGGLDLGEDDLYEVTLEARVGGGQRIDVELGATVVEVKKPAVLASDVRHSKAVDQLAEYVRARVGQTGQRYVGVLTDGARWELYHLTLEGLFREVSTFQLDGKNPDPAGLSVWLEGVLATRSAIKPTPGEIEARLGYTSPSFQLDLADLRALYDTCRQLPEVQVKRELWGRLLRDALGTAFDEGDDELWIRHTYLVVAAELIAHAVVGIDLRDPSLTGVALLSGERFAAAQIGGVVESDFFDWPNDVDAGASLIKTIARRLARFDWSEVDHDVLKVLYESVIDAETRHSLGEYYTPDWLAERMVSEAVDYPLVQRVLDPACGSGTFVFWAVRRYLEEASAQGMSNQDAIEGVTSHVFGIDLHPVAATLARVTYLLAIGLDRIRQDRGPFTVPVYVGDSVQWRSEESVFGSRGLVVYTTDGAELFAQELVFPHRILDRVREFDRLVTELTRRATDRKRGSPTPSITQILSRYGVHPDDRADLERTFEVLCHLHDQHRNHIWGYYVRNRARPAWFARPNSQVDVLIGNPPWLSYRYMPADLQQQFAEFSKERRLWAGGKVATHQDLSGLFVARTVELYLKTGGRFAFVMPAAVLSRQQYKGFRSGSWSSTTVTVAAQFAKVWDLSGIEPTVFPVPSSVLFGIRAQESVKHMPDVHEAWAASISHHHRRWADVEGLITAKEQASVLALMDGPGSSYGELFAQGATILPRVLLTVDEVPPGALGLPEGYVRVRSRRSTYEKQPWKGLESVEGNVERQFVFRTLLGESIVPYRVVAPILSVLPWDGIRLLYGDDGRIDGFPGLAKWWRRAESEWEDHRTSDMTLVDRINYQRTLTNQFPVPPHRVVYTKSGANLCAAYVGDIGAVIDHKLYWAAVGSPDEADFLCGILNSSALLELVRPLQSVGQFGPRDFDKYVFKIPIPLFNPDEPIHQEIREHATAIRKVVEQMDLTGLRYQKARSLVTEEIARLDVSTSLESLVTGVLPSEAI